jgi:hypothetical protein
VNGETKNSFDGVDKNREDAHEEKKLDSKGTAVTSWVQKGPICEVKSEFLEGEI